mgnify:CR=1 FL=1
MKQSYFMQFIFSPQAHFDIAKCPDTTRYYLLKVAKFLFKEGKEGDDDATAGDNLITFLSSKPIFTQQTNRKMEDEGQERRLVVAKEFTKFIKNIPYQFFE